jgi:membrane dipeptidase
LPASRQAFILRPVLADLDPAVQALRSEKVAIDLHADTPVLLRLGYDLGVRHDPILPRAAAGFHVDVPRLREGGIGAQFFGLPSWPIRWPWGPGSTVDRLLDALERAAQRHVSDFALVHTAAEVRAARAAGKIAGLRGIEGAHALEGRLDRVAHFAARGVAYLGLLHFTANEAGAPAFGSGRDATRGLTDFGRELVDELNRCRVIADLAHINRAGFLEAAARSRAPVLVSHTGVSGVHRHWRNIDDDQIRAVAESGGCIGVIYSRRYLGADDLDGVCDHIEHIVRVGGEDAPALGSDWDGFVTPPEGLEDASQLPNLTAALLRRGLSEHVVRKILGDNALRVLEAVAG